MNLQKIMFFGIVMVILNGCGEGSNSNQIDDKDSIKTTEVSEDYNSEKRLFPIRETTIQYDFQDINKESAIIISTCKYNNKNLMIEQMTTMHEYNKSKVILTISTKVHYDNQNRYIGHETIQKNFISNQPTRIVHSSATMKYRNNRIVEEYYYREGILVNKWIVTKWDGNKPTKRQKISYSKDAKEIDTSTQINTYEGENIIHTELHKGDGSVIIIDRVFDDKKTPEGNDVSQRGHYVYCWTGNNNIVSETFIFPNTTITIENKLKYNSYDMLIEKDSYNYSTGSVLREKTIIEYVER